MVKASLFKKQENCKSTAEGCINIEKAVEEHGLFTDHLTVHVVGNASPESADCCFSSFPVTADRLDPPSNDASPLSPEQTTPGAQFPSHLHCQSKAQQRRFSMEVRAAFRSHVFTSLVFLNVRKMGSTLVTAKRNSDMDESNMSCVKCVFPFVVVFLIPNFTQLSEPLRKLSTIIHHERMTFQTTHLIEC